MKYVLVARSNGWIDSVSVAKWTPPQGLFTQSAAKIAQTLYDNSDSLKQAMARLNFYPPAVKGSVLAYATSVFL